MRQHENYHEVPHDFVELVMKETLYQGMFDDFLMGRLPETLEQSHFSGVSPHLAPLEDPRVVHGDDILVQSYSLIQVFLELLQGPGNVLHHGG